MHRPLHVLEVTQEYNKDSSTALNTPSSSSQSTGGGGTDGKGELNTRSEASQAEGASDTTVSHVNSKHLVANKFKISIITDNLDNKCKTINCS